MVYWFQSSLVALQAYGQRESQGAMHHRSKNAPHVTFAFIAVIALARSDARRVAAFATSTTSGNRRSIVRVPRSASYSSGLTPRFSACTDTTLCTLGASGDPADRRTMSRTPYGPSSHAKLR